MTSQDYYLSTENPSDVTEEDINKQTNRTETEPVTFKHTSPGMMMSSRLLPSLRHQLSRRLLVTAASRTMVVKQPDLLSATLAFEDPSAFKVKSWKELLRALGIFRFCSFPVLVNNSGRVRLWIIIIISKKVT